jgi:hypothetical protein
MPSGVGLGAELVSGHSGELRISMDATEERAGISFGGQYHWKYPGETIGFGSFTTLRATIKF